MCRECPDQNWVQCDDCLKWRKLQDGINPDKLPDKWFCRMNPNPEYRFVSFDFHFGHLFLYVNDYKCSICVNSGNVKHQRKLKIMEMKHPSRKHTKSSEFERCWYLKSTPKRKPPSSSLLLLQKNNAMHYRHDGNDVYL